MPTKAAGIGRVADCNLYIKETLYARNQRIQSLTAKTLAAGDTLSSGRWMRQRRELCGKSRREEPPTGVFDKRGLSGYGV